MQIHVRNRYNNVLPEEHSRVKLSNNQFYINANYIYCEDEKIQNFNQNDENIENQKKENDLLLCNTNQNQ